MNSTLCTVLLKILHRQHFIWINCNILFRAFHLQSKHQMGVNGTRIYVTPTFFINIMVRGGNLNRSLSQKRLAWVNLVFIFWEDRHLTFYTLNLNKLICTLFFPAVVHMWISLNLRILHLLFSAKLVVESISFGRVRIRGTATDYFLCVDKKGRLRARVSRLFQFFFRLIYCLGLT